MKKLEMEGALSRAVCQAPLLDFNALAAIPVEKMSSHDWITIQRKKPSIKLKPISAVAASFLVGVVVYSGWFAQFKMADSVIALDVNQSVEIVTNRQNKVLSVRPLNEVAQKVLAGKDFYQADLNDSINTIVSGLIEYGYLNESDKTILVSVKNSDTQKADQLAASVSDTIEATADQQELSPTILNQTYDKTDKEEENLAESLNVTTGKMNVMTVINEADTEMELSTLATMSMDQLIDLSQEKGIDLSGVIKTDETDTNKVKNSTDKVSESLEKEEAGDVPNQEDTNQTTAVEEPSVVEEAEETAGVEESVVDEKIEEIQATGDTEATVGSQDQQAVPDQGESDIEPAPDKTAQSVDSKSPDQTLEENDQTSGQEDSQELSKDLTKELDGQALQE